MGLFERSGLKHLFSGVKRLNHPADYRHVAAERSEEGVAVMAVDGTLQFVNSAWASMHGYGNRESLIGGNIRQFYARKGIESFNRFVAQTRQLGWYITTIEHLRKDGSTFEAQLKMAVLKDDNAKPQAILLVAADLSRVGQLQKMLQQTNEELALLRAWVGRLEEIIRTSRSKYSYRADVEPAAVQAAPGLPVAELKQLAEMARRFR